MSNNGGLRYKNYVPFEGPFNKGSLGIFGHGHETQRDRLSFYITMNSHCIKNFLGMLFFSVVFHHGQGVNFKCQF
jgi:hypothetical protein